MATIMDEPKGDSVVQARPLPQQGHARRLRIAVFVFQFPVISETFIFNQLKGILEQGHDLTVFAIQGKPSVDEEYSTAWNERELIKRVRFPQELPSNRFWRKIVLLKMAMSPVLLNRNLSRIVYSLKGLRQMFGLRAIMPVLGEPNPSYDIIHAQFGILGDVVLALRKARFIAGPLITHFRGFDISAHVQSKGADAYRDLFRHGEAFLANCEHFRQRAIELGCPPELIRVLGTGISSADFRYVSRDSGENRPIHLVSVGRLVEKKGWEYSIRAAAILIAEGLEIDYAIVGEGHLRDDLTRIIRECGVSDHVKLLGKREPSEVAELLTASDIFVAASVTAASGDQDAPVNTLKEAMATGLPVVATRHGGIPELVEHGVSGLLVPERDGAAIAGSLRMLINDAAMRLRFGKAGRRRIEEQYDIRKLNADLLRIYQEVASKHPLNANESIGGE